MEMLIKNTYWNILTRNVILIEFLDKFDVNERIRYL